METQIDAWWASKMNLVFIQSKCLPWPKILMHGCMGFIFLQFSMQVLKNDQYGNFEGVPHGFDDVALHFPYLELDDVALGDLASLD